MCTREKFSGATSRVRSAMWLWLALVAAACADRVEAPNIAPPAPPVQEIVDGARNGNAHFFFLPPLVSQPTVGGVVDPDAGPTVVVCEWDTSVPTGRCDRLIQQFSRLERVTDVGDVDRVGEIRFNGNHYHVNWDTQSCLSGPCELSASKTYRIRVLVGATELGHADVAIVPDQKAVKNVNTAESIALVDGKKLQLKFLIEKGAYAVVAPGTPAVVGAEGGAIISNDGEVALTIPPGALSSSTSIAVDPSVEVRPGTGPWSDPVELGPDGTTFASPVTLTLKYDVRQLPAGVIPEALRLQSWANDHWEEVAGSTVNLDDATVSAPISHFSGYSIGIWPNTVQSQPGPSTLYVGQSLTYGGSAFYWNTYPGTYCYTYSTWVSRWWGGGYWQYYTQCYTYEQTYLYPVSGRVTWTSSAPSVATVAPPGYSFAVNGSTVSPVVTALAPGVTWINARFGNVVALRALTVVPQITFDVFASGAAPLRRIGFRQGTGVNARIPQAAAAPLTVALSHSSSAVATSNPSVTIATGATQEGFTLIAGTVAGRDTIVGSATGYGPDTLIVETAPGRIVVTGWPSSLAYGDSALIRIRPMNPDSLIIDNAWQTAFALSSNGKLAFSYGNASITSIHVPDGTSSTPAFYVKAIGSGAAVMGVENPMYVAGPYALTVSPPPFTSIQVQPTPVGVKPGQTVQLTGTALDAAQQPVTGVPLEWTSSNASIASVDANGVVSGLSVGTATITATNGAVSGSATVKVGTPAIAPSTNSVTIQVQQGQSNSAQITINNGGTGLLTGLQAGVFSNYFNGSLTPWVTASLNTTTAPAILTITAAPGMSIPAGVHQLRFDVSAPGVPTYTFYSINVTVVAAGVTPVNATIAPSLSSLTFSVEQGTSASRQITINNSGTDPLTNLSAGVFSNYFTGALTPWVSATLNSTTAPAVLTITAAPGLTIPATSYQLRFDVASPGATNSPYTFYSINVTVTPTTQPQYTVRDLGIVGATGWSEANTLNDAGRIVGSSNNSAFYMDAASSTPIATPNPYGDIYFGVDVNASGVLAIWQPYTGFLWSPETNTFQGPPPGPFAQNNRRMVVALNNTGLVLASADNGSYAQNYVWNVATNSTTLITGAFNWGGGRINDAGVSITSADPGAGGTARLWNQSTQVATVIPSLGGVTIGRDLNATSVAVGSSTVNGKRHAFRFDPATGQTRDLGTLGGLESEAMGINDAGYIVGWSLNAAGQKRGFIWDPTRDRMYELAPIAGQSESQANDINQSGVIVGYSGAGSTRRATRWTPQ